VRPDLLAAVVEDVAEAPTRDVTGRAPVTEGAVRLFDVEEALEPAGRAEGTAALRARVDVAVVGRVTAVGLEPAGAVVRAADVAVERDVATEGRAVGFTAAVRVGMGQTSEGRAVRSPARGS
jgi:hypothetical protein